MKLSLQFLLKDAHMRKIKGLDITINSAWNAINCGRQLNTDLGLSTCNVYSTGGLAPVYPDINSTIDFLMVLPSRNHFLVRIYWFIRKNLHLEILWFHTDNSIRRKLFEIFGENDLGVHIKRFGKFSDKMIK